VRDYSFLYGNAKRLRVRIQAILLHLFNWKMHELVAAFTAKAIRIFHCCQREIKYVSITRIRCRLRDTYSYYSWTVLYFERTLSPSIEQCHQPVKAVSLYLTVPLNDLLAIIVNISE